MGPACECIVHCALCGVGACGAEQRVRTKEELRAAKAALFREQHEDQAQQAAKVAAKREADRAFELQLLASAKGAAVSELRGKQGKHTGVQEEMRRAWATALAAKGRKQALEKALLHSP